MKNAAFRKFKKQHRGAKGFFFSFLLSLIGAHEVDDDGFVIDEFGDPID